MALAASSVAITIRCGNTLGNTSLSRMRQVEAPADCAAATYSRERTCCVALRMTTAKRSHFSSPSTRMTTGSEPPTRATVASATRITGIDRRVVTRKVTSMSTLPPK